jgi:hypothetical protein
MIVLSLNTLVRELVCKWKRGTEPNTTTHNPSCKVSIFSHPSPVKPMTPKEKRNKMKIKLDFGFKLWDNK